MVEAKTILPKRIPNRLKGYDYSQEGMYFITICVKDNKPLLGAIVGAATCRPHNQLSKYGEIVNKTINNIPGIYPGVWINKYIIMPNHMHLLIAIEINGRQVAAPTMSRIIGNMKRMVSVCIGFSPWQKSFHDHIVRCEKDYLRIAEYIENNPAKWEADRFYVSSGNTPE